MKEASQRGQLESNWGVLGGFNDSRDPSYALPFGQGWLGGTLTKGTKGSAALLKPLPLVDPKIFFRSQQGKVHEDEWRPWLVLLLGLLLCLFFRVGACGGDTNPPSTHPAHMLQSPSKHFPTSFWRKCEVNAPLPFSYPSLSITLLPVINFYSIRKLIPGWWS